MSRIKENSTFIVTGGLGFIGSHFVEKILGEGHRVINYDKVTYAAHLDLKFSGDYLHIEKDISEIKSLPYCDYIVNFAAESHVDNSIEDSFSFVKSISL